MDDASDLLSKSVDQPSSWCCLKVTPTNQRQYASPCKYPYTKGCEYLTYFNASGDLFREVCNTFSSCEETHACTNCLSETEWCYAICGKNFYGVIDNNLIDLVGNVDSESDCKDLCISTETCTYYTYFTEDDLNSKACVLLSSLMGTFQNCDTCLTEPVDCKGDCSLQYKGENHRLELRWSFFENG